MDLVSALKMFCTSASVVSALASCFFWYKSSKAEVMFSELRKGEDDIGLEAGGKEIAVFATSRKQSSLGAKGAFAAAVAALFQLILFLIDFWSAMAVPA